MTYTQSAIYALALIGALKISFLLWAEFFRIRLFFIRTGNLQTRVLQLENREHYISMELRKVLETLEKKSR